MSFFTCGGSANAGKRISHFTAPVPLLSLLKRGIKENGENPGLHKWH